MEEKEVTMSGQTTPDETKKEEKFDINKVPREDLIKAISQLNEQLRMAGAQINNLKRELAGIDWNAMRLNYLFKVLELRNAFNDPEFIGNVCDEVKEMITIKEEPEKEETKE